MNINSQSGLDIRLAVENRADENEESYRSAFVGYAVELLEEDGQLVGPEVFGSTTGVIDAVDWDPSLRRLTAVAVQFDPHGWGRPWRAAATQQVAEQASEQLQDLFDDRAEQARDAGALGSFIADISKDTKSVRIVVVANAAMAEHEPMDLDAALLAKAESVGLGHLRGLQSRQGARGRHVNLAEMTGGGLPVIGPFGRQGMDSYLVVVPGDALADLYHQHGAGILGRNVRAFLQVRNKVNKGIQESLKSEPDKFFAYNNGLSLTASSVTRGLSQGRTVLVAADDLEIVNGGQTTASLHHAKYQRGVDLSEVYVQAKLTVLAGDESADEALSIARFANTQSPVRMGDLTSNNPFFAYVQDLSRTTRFSVGGREVAWYFERMRGQFVTEQESATASGKGLEFEAAFDRRRKFDKAQLAKLELVRMQKPHVVTAGGEKSLSTFAQQLANDRAISGKPDGGYFSRLVARQILWLATDKVIAALDLGGHKATDVAYTMALLFARSQNRLKLDDVALKQDAGDDFRDAVAGLAPLVHERLLESAGTRNPHSWAKTEPAWEAVQSIAWSIPDVLVGTNADNGSGKRVVTKRGDVGLDLPVSQESSEATDRVVGYGADAWFELSKWAKEADELQTWQRSIAFSIGRVLSSGKQPTEKQVVQAVKILDASAQLGFRPTFE